MSPSHLHAVATEPTDLLPGENRVAVLCRGNQAAADAEELTELIGLVRGDLDGSDLVALRDRLTETAAFIADARRLVDQAGHDWIVANGKKNRADIDGETYRATVSGTTLSLKVADKARLADAFFRDRLAPWLAEQLGEDDGDEDSDDTVTRLWLSLVAGKITESFTLDPKPTVLAEQWQLDARTYATPTSGAGQRPTFEKVLTPTPPTPKENT